MRPIRRGYRPSFRQMPQQPILLRREPKGENEIQQSFGHSSRPFLGQPVLGLLLLGALLSLSAPRMARANSGDTFLETIGIGIAVGTVLGASTLPFYDQPGKHLVNLAYGAGAGAAVGVGVAVYGWLSGGSDHDEQVFHSGSRTFALRRQQLPRARRQTRALVPNLPPTTIVWSPIVSLSL